MLRKVWLLVLLLSGLPGHAAVMGQEVEYVADGVTLKGYVAFDDEVMGKRPGVLVVHEWWGQNEYARNRARMLASLGYVALAVDMYGGGKQAAHPQDAGKFASTVMSNAELARQRFVAALTLLRQHPNTDAKRIAAIGYCFGGGLVLNMARAGLDLDGVVSFHGSYATDRPALKGGIKAAILVAHGAEDGFSSAEDIAALKQEMRAAGADFQWAVYEGAQHGFTNPAADEYAEKFKISLAYNAQADEQSWRDMQTFLSKVFAD